MAANITHRVGYCAVKTVLVLAVLALPPPRFRRHEPSAVAMAIALVLCTAAYMVLQGSDPGYLTDELLRQAMDADEEEGNLLTTEEEDDESDDDQLHSLATKSEKRFRTRRIQQIQGALKQLETRNPQEPSRNDDLDERHNSDSTNNEPLEMEVMDTLDLEASAASDLEDDLLEAFCAECSLFPVRFVVDKYSPLRSRHCRACGRCVATFDHHCLLLATCIGEKNHGRFWWFLVFQTMELTLGVLRVTARFQPRTADASWTHVNGWPIFLFSILAILLLFVGSMLAFHTFLAMSAMTTYEFGRGGDKISYLRGFRECDLPFSRGLCTNLACFCRPSSFVPSSSSCLLFSSSSSSSSASTSTKRHHQHSALTWRPMLWKRPTPLDRDSDKICENLVQGAQFAPNHFLGKCLDAAWVREVETKLNISATARDKLLRLEHPYLHAALTHRRYVIKDPRISGVDITKIYNASCASTPFTFWGQNAIVDATTGAVLNKGTADGSMVIEWKGWASYQLTAMTFAILAREVLGYEISFFKTSDSVQMAERMATTGEGLCVPIHANIEEWGRNHDKFSGESYKAGTHSYVGRSGLYTTKSFVTNGTDVTKYSPVFNADFWRDYTTNDQLIDALSVDILRSNTKYFPPTETGCADGTLGCQDACSRTDTCTARELAHKKCMVLLLMYDYYDQGWAEAVLANRKIPSYHCFLGWSGVESYAVEMEATGVPVMFYHYEPDPFHFVHAGKFERVFLPRSLPQLAALNTASFGENGFGGVTTNPVAVDFSVSTLNKFGSNVLLDHAPMASLLSRISLTEADMNALLTIYVNITSHGAAPPASQPDDPIFSTACSWIRNNYLTWKNWLDRMPVCGILEHMNYTLNHCADGKPREIVWTWINPDPSDPSKPFACDGGASLPATMQTSRSCVWLKDHFFTWLAWVFAKPQCDASFYSFRVSECDSRAKRTATHYWLLEDPTDATKSLECADGVALPGDVELDCKFVPYSTPIFQVIAILAGILATTLVGMVGFVVKYRAEPIIKRSQYEFLVVMIVGGILMTCSAVLYAGEPSGFRCGARPLVTALAFTLIFGSLVVKSLRVYRVFMTGAMKRVVLSSTTMFKILGIFVSVDLLIILAWFVVDFPAPDETETAVGALNGGIVVQQVCMSSSFIFSALLIFWKAIVLFMGLYLSFLIRNVSSDFQESTWIFASSLVVLFASIVILPMAYLVELPELVFYAFLAFMLLGCTALVMSMMLLPKIRRLHERASETTTTTVEKTNADSNSVSVHEDSKRGTSSSKVGKIRLGMKAQVQVTPVQEFRPKSTKSEKSKGKSKKKKQKGAPGATSGSSSSSSED